MPEPMDPQHQDAAEAALRRALSARAAAVDPGTAPRVGDLVPPRRRWPAAAAVAAGVAVLAVASAVALRPGDDPSPVAGPSDTATVSVVPEPTDRPTDRSGDQATDGSSDEPTTTAPDDPSPSTSGPTDQPGTGVGGTTAILWFVTEQADLRSGGTGLRLVPDRIPVRAAADPETQVRVAVDRLLSAPALDPDYVNGWWWDGQSSGGAALGVAVRDSGTTVDLPAEAFDGPVGSQYAGFALAAMVRTVVSNGGTAPVTLLVDGEPDGEVWGAYVLDRPLEPSSDDLAGGWILDPYEGQRVPAGTVRVSGTATAFEANVLWEVTDAGGAPVADGFTMAGANGEYGPFSFTVDLAPGTYTVTVREPSMADPDEGPDLVWQDTTTISVVE
jgi:hypothetical protein